LIPTTPAVYEFIPEQKLTIEHRTYKIALLAANVNIDGGILTEIAKIFVTKSNRLRHQLP
jgi:hypothetical protein